MNDPGMIIFRSNRPFTWGGLDVPMLGIVRDWFGQSLVPPAGYSLVLDPSRLWFIAQHSRPADVLPTARPGDFCAGLWNHDVGELFLADPVSGRYFEFNLAANGAWWACEFVAARQRAEAVDIVVPEVATFADLAPDGSWLAAMAIPLDILMARINFGESSRANVTMILESPRQRFLSATDLGEGEPDFHRPDAFSPLRFHSLEHLLGPSPELHS